MRSCPAGTASLLGAFPPPARTALGRPRRLSRLFPGTSLAGSLLAAGADAARDWAAGPVGMLGAGEEEGEEALNLTEMVRPSAIWPSKAVMEA